MCSCWNMFDITVYAYIISFVIGRNICTFAGRYFRDIRDFGLFSRELMPGKKLEEKFAKVIFAKNKLFQNRESFFEV